MVSPSDATTVAASNAITSIQRRVRRPRTSSTRSTGSAGAWPAAVDSVSESAASASIAVAEAVSSISPRVRSRSHAGAGMNTGVVPSNATGLTSRCRSSSQMAQVSMWREMRLRISTVKWPSQPSRIAASSGQPPPVFRTRRETSSAPADRYGRTVHQVSRWLASSKTCSACGHRLDELPLQVRRWTCPTCWVVHDRDYNAAKIILAAGRAERLNASHASGRDHESGSGGVHVRPQPVAAVGDEAGSTPPAA